MLVFRATVRISLGLGLQRTSVLFSKCGFNGKLHSACWDIFMRLKKKKKLKVIKFQIKGWIYFIAHTVRLVPYFVDSEFGLHEKLLRDSLQCHFTIIRFYAAFSRVGMRFFCRYVRILGN